MLRRLLVLLAVLLITGCAARATSERAIGSDLPFGFVEPTRASGTVPPLHPSVDEYPEATLRLVDRSMRSATVVAKVAETPERRRHGLMEVPALPDGVGMLFVFPVERGGSFWMKNTLVPLDVAFLDRDGAVKAILRMEPCTSWWCPAHDPGISYRYALEVRGGWFGQVGVDTGWRVELPRDLPPAT